MNISDVITTDTDVINIASNVGNNPLTPTQLAYVYKYLESLPIHAVRGILRWFEHIPYWQLVYTLMWICDRDVFKEQLIYDGHGANWAPPDERTDRTSLYECRYYKELSEYYQNKYIAATLDMSTIAADMEMKLNVPT
jgi:hypothetical protein